MAALASKSRTRKSVKLYVVPDACNELSVHANDTKLDGEVCGKQHEDCNPERWSNAAHFGQLVDVLHNRRTNALRIVARVGRSVAARRSDRASGFADSAAVKDRQTVSAERKRLTAKADWHDRAGHDWTGLDWSGLVWTGLQTNWYAAILEAARLCRAVPCRASAQRPAGAVDQLSGSHAGMRWIGLVWRAQRLLPDALGARVAAAGSGLVLRC